MAQPGDADPATDTIPPPKRHRWARRELWFVLLVVVAIAAVLVARQYVDPAQPADGPPLGGLTGRPEAPSTTVP